MAKFNVRDTRAAVGRGPLTTTGPALTHEGGAGFARDLKSELFLLAVANMVGEDTFYEKAAERDARYEELIRQATTVDPQWTAGLLRWLRGEGNMRSASIAGAAIFAHERLKLPDWQRLPRVDGPNLKPGLIRSTINAVCRRADEPGEMIAYWMSHFGRNIPKPVKRGVADAATRLYTEYALLKYDTASHGFRFGDVLDLTHPAPRSQWQRTLFRHALDRRHNHATDMDAIVGHLPMVLSQAALRAGVAAGKTHLLLNPETLKAAGMTWEDALSLAGPTVDKAVLWSALIPSMGYMALLRNLRNFDEAGVPSEVAASVCARLADEDEVARSRQFPFRFLSAYENVSSLRWSLALDIALTHSLKNIPKLAGPSLVLIDTSSSMTQSYGRASSSPAKVAAVFGVALAMACGADVFGFADRVFRHDLVKGGSLIQQANAFIARTGEVGHGTQIARSLAATYRGHRRVFIISDMQTMGGATTNVPVSRGTSLYGFNLGGYGVAALDARQPNTMELGGLTDATFKMVPLIEAGATASWPWLQP